MSRYPLFRSAVETILGTWSALKLAVENGQGGSHGKDIAEWMIGALENYFYENDGLMGSEVAEVLGQMMNNELDTVVEDHSLEDIGEQLTEYFRMCQNNQESQLSSILEKLKLAAVSSTTLSNSVQIAQDSSDSSDEEMETDEVSTPKEPKAEGAGTSSGATSRRSGRMHVSEPDDDGWAVVSKGKPR